MSKACILTGVTGNRVTAPGRPSASSIGAATAAPAPVIPPSPAPLIPNGLSGLGAMIMYAGRLADMQSVLVGVISASLLGFATISLLELMRYRLLVWHQETSAAP